MNAHAKRPETEKMCISCIMHLNGYMSLIVICKRFHFLVEILIQACNMIPCQCCQLLVMDRTPFYLTNSNIIFRTLNELKHVHLSVIELKHSIFGFEQKNIKPDKPFTIFTTLLIELTRTSFFWTSNKLEHVHLMVIELKHPNFGFEGSNIELRT